VSVFVDGPSVAVVRLVKLLRLLRTFKGYKKMQVMASIRFESCAAEWGRTSLVFGEGRAPGAPHVVVLRRW
jgi:hypothetical protein